MKRFIALALICLAPLACGKRPIAVVNGEVITSDMLDEFISEKNGGFKDTAPSGKTARTAALEELINERLILQGAREMKIAVSDADALREIESIKTRIGADAFQRHLKEKKLSQEKFRRRIKDSLVINKFAETIVPENSVTEEEIRQFYKNSLTPFLEPERIFVRFMETDAESNATAILKEMKEKKLSFDEMADRAAQKNGVTVSDYGWTQHEFFSPSVSAAMKNLKTGSIGGPYKGKNKYYIFYVKDRKKPSVKSLDAARPEIKAKLLKDKRQEILGHWIGEKRKSASIKIKTS